MIDRYGTTIPLKNSELLEKTHQTNIEKYGVATPMELEEFRIKHQEIMEEKYGVKFVSQVPKFREKQRQTCFEKYGFYNVFSSPTIQENNKKIILEKYGVDSLFKNTEIKNKRDKTMMIRYGAIYPIQNQQIAEKIKSTNLERYGVDNVSKSPEIKEKIAKTLYQKGNVPSSSQQLYLYNLYNTSGNLKYNYPISYYHADICSPEEKFVIEYDGSGHDVQVKYGILTLEKFKQKEIVRSAVFKHNGYKTMRIISSKDKLPSDSILLQLLSITKQYFSDYPQHSWITFNIDSSSIFNAENKEGIFFDYGQLRKLSKCA